MIECDFASLGLSFREIHKKWEYGDELHRSLYCARTRELVASFSATVRISGGDQVLNVNEQFIQRNYLTLGQINAVTEWLREQARAARWRLTTYTVMVEARP